MRLQEYQGKELFKRVGIPVSEGGIKLANSPAEARQHAEKILGMSIKGERVHKVLVTRAVEIEREFYLSITVDRRAKRPVVIFSSEGGMEIEEVATTNPNAIIKFHIDPLLGLQSFQVRDALYCAAIDGSLMRPLSDFFIKLYQAFTQFKANLVEINPLAIVDGGKLIAVDSKFIVDDEEVPAEIAGWENEELTDNPQEQMAKKDELQYVKLDGEIGIIGNGAGLVMSTLDLVALKGGKPANFLDIGGGANAEQMKKALQIVLSDPQVKGLFINIFGGITRCDEVAKGLVATRHELGIRVPMVVRLTGTNEAEGKEILTEDGIAPVGDMEVGAAEIVRRVRVAQ
ncbi:ADP-forming succinate--CoA ligase subunit beta [Candidatus Acetothermia bacterium]|nr:ADP-forming succinate--CoA ligase subunit beta [Candidatus Acetothermia bacterium]